MPVGGRANAAYALCYVPGVTGVPALKNDLKSPEQRPRRPSVFDLAAFDFDIDP
jgi:hypothetical protein